MSCRPFVLLCVLAFLATVAAAGPPEPVYYNGFDDGKIDGPVGKAGDRLAFDGRGIVDLDRGTLAFFHQSKEAPRETEWGGLGGINATRDSGYWTMGVGFHLRRRDFLLAFFDAASTGRPSTSRVPSAGGRPASGTTSPRSGTGTGASPSTRTASGPIRSGESIAGPGV